VHSGVFLPAVLKVIQTRSIPSVPSFPHHFPVRNIVVASEFVYVPSSKKQISSEIKVIVRTPIVTMEKREAERKIPNRLKITSRQQILEKQKLLDRL